VGRAPQNQNDTSSPVISFTETQQPSCRGFVKQWSMRLSSGLLETPSHPKHSSKVQGFGLGCRRLGVVVDFA